MAKIEIETRYTVYLSEMGHTHDSGAYTFRFNGADHPEMVRDALIWCLENLRNSEIKTDKCTIFLTTTDESDITAFKLRWC